MTVNLGYIMKKVISELSEIQRLKLFNVLLKSCPIKASER